MLGRLAYLCWGGTAFRYQLGVCLVCVWHFIVLGSVLTPDNFVIFIVFSFYPYALLIMLSA